MAKFCTYCGKPLPESGVCDCEQSAAARAAANAAPEAAAEPAAQPNAQQAAPGAQAAPLADNVYVQKTKAAVSQSVPFVKDYWKDPINATRRALQENNLAMAIVMMVVNAVISGLLVFACLSKLAGTIKSTTRDLGGLFGESMRISVSAPFFASMFYGILMSVLVLVLSVLILFVLLKVFKVDAKFEYLVITVGVNSVIPSACLVLTLLCALVGLTIPMLIFLVLGVVAWGVLGVLLLTKLFGVQPSGLFVVLTMLFLTIAIGINVWLGSKLFVKALGQVEVEDVKVEEVVEEIQDRMDDFDLEDVIGDAIGSFMY